MELYAIYICLKITSQNLYLYSDSMYAINCLTLWHQEWQRNNWKNAKGQAVKNRQLIEDILELMKNRHIVFIHVFAHTGNYYNEIADQLATAANSHRQEQIIEKKSSS
jgi:ribonuclease HI